MAPASVSSPASADPADIASGVWSVYLLRCGDGSLYCGVTTDLARRIDQHSAGRGARYTRGRGPLTLVYQETQPSSSLALKREAAIKRLTRADKEAMIRAGGDPRLPGKTPAKKRARAENRAAD